MLFRLYRKATNLLIIVKPSTLLDWQRGFVKTFWTYKHKKPGRKPVLKEIKELILLMKQDEV